MPSNFLKVMLALTGLSPALLSLYFAKIIHDFPRMAIYIRLNTWNDIVTGTRQFLENQYLLLLFLILVFVARFIVRLAKRKFAVGRIELKAVKPADINFLTTFFSIIPLFIKLYNPAVSDLLIIVVYLVAGIVMGLTMKASFHYNLTLKLLLGYSHYEIQTKAEITYLILSRKPLINRNAITEYVKLAEHMLLDVSDKK